MSLPAIRYLIVILLFFLPGMGSAQLFGDFNFTFKTYTTSNGLAHNSIKKSISDSKGFLWLATENGLSRFDGNRFKNYRNIPGDSTSLPNNNLWDIAIDDRDQVYVAYVSGVSVLNPSTGRFTELVYKNNPVQSKAIAWDKKRQTLYIFSNTGLLAYNTVTQKFTATSLKINSPAFIWQLYLDRDDYLWALVERKGYYRYSIQKDTAYYYNSEDWPMSMYQDMKGAYHISTWGSGFQVFQNLKDENRKSIYQLKLSDLPGYNYVFGGIAEAPLLTGDDILWVTTHTSGIGLFSKSKKNFVHHFSYKPGVKNGINSFNYWNIYAAPDSVLWICGWHGLTKVNRQTQFFQNAELPELNTASYNCITGIMDDPRDQKTAWMAINGSGVARYDKQTSKIAARYFYDAADVRTYYDMTWPVYLFRDSNNVIWSGTYGGFIKIKSGQVSYKPLTDNGTLCYPESNFQDSRGYIWQTGRKLFQFNPYTEVNHSWDIKGPDNKNLFYRGICEGPDRNMYAATNSGLIQLDPVTGKSARLPFAAVWPDSTNWNEVLAVVCIDSVIYMGTKKGLAAYNVFTKKSHRIGENRSLHTIGSNALYKDKLNNLWIYCSSGLFRYIPARGELDQFTSAEGVYAHNNDPAYFFEYNGYVYMGARGAYTKFNPSFVNTNQSVPAPYITEVAINGSVLNYFNNQPVELSYKNNNLSFDFTAIEYNFPEKLSFSYMLEGYDIDWSPPSAVRSKNYTNLPEGDYVFKVKAFNNNGVESNTHAALSFSIKPPFWRTWWFKLILALAIIGLLYGIFWWRIHAVKNRQEEKNVLQQLQLGKYKQELETEQITSFFSSSLVGKDNIRDVMTDVAKNLIGKMGFEDCMIYLWNDDKTKLIQHAGHGIKGAIENTEDQEKYHIPAGRGVVGRAVELKQPLLINDTSADLYYFSADDIIRYSELCVPVIADDEVLGAINIEHTEKNYFTKQHLQTVSTIAALMANKLKAIEDNTALHQKQLELATASSQLTRTELTLLRSQMNPHFIFNSLNSVQKYIWENKEEDAAEYLASFARLMRAILEHSRHELISLQQEMEVLKLYIDLEHRRSNKNFDYMIRIDESVNQETTMVPPMLLQPFIENAIWHGLNKKKEKGNLLIHVFKENLNLHCIVDDDGVGRLENTGSENVNKSLGISITRQRIERLMQDASKQASVTIEDKNIDGKPAGTRVVVILPLQTQTDHA